MARASRGGATGFVLMTPQQQVQLALAIGSQYPGGAPLDETIWRLVDRTFLPGDPVSTALILTHLETGKTAKANRGSLTLKDWLDDFTASFIPSDWFNGRVEDGFHDYWEGSRTESGRILPALDWTGGHSLGGPAATYDACQQAPGTVDLLLIATPEPGDDLFSLWASPRIRNIHRWENPHDVVPDAPGRFLGYRDLLGPVTPIDMGPLGVDHWDIPGNHHLPNYIAAFLKQYQGILQ